MKYYIVTNSPLQGDLKSPSIEVNNPTEAIAIFLGTISEIGPSFVMADGGLGALERMPKELLDVVKLLNIKFPEPSFYSCRLEDESGLVYAYIANEAFANPKVI